jgi:hypothetical protein
MILPGQLGGKVGRRRDFLTKASRSMAWGFCVFGGLPALRLRFEKEGDEDHETGNPRAMSENP